MDVRQAIEIDPDFEPQQRVRCNTWPCRPREDVVEAQCSPVSDESTADNHVKPENLGLNKKTSSRRNAWGNLSYADLITKAIQSSTEQRLTLSQIYDWMVQNVPYFKDKGDSTSSAGWKVCTMSLFTFLSCGWQCPLLILVGYLFWRDVVSRPRANKCPVIVGPSLLFWEFRCKLSHDSCHFEIIFVVFYRLYLSLKITSIDFVEINNVL